MPKSPRRPAANRKAGTTPPAGPTTPAPEPGLPELVLRAARDIGKVDTAFDAELLLSTLLGSVYAGTLPDRAPAVRSFTRALREHLATADASAAPVVAAVLAALTGPGEPTSTSTSTSAPTEPAPAWLDALGSAQVTGGYAYGDRYGDQTSYLVTYAYPDELLGGPEHAVLLLVDHNLGLVKDIVIAAPAGPVLDQLRGSVLEDPDAMTWLSEVAPATIRAAAMAYLQATDRSAELPESDSLTANWALAMARLAILPAHLPQSNKGARSTGATGAESGTAGSDTQPSGAARGAPGRSFTSAPDPAQPGDADLDPESEAAQSDAAQLGAAQLGGSGAGAFDAESGDEQSGGASGDDAAKDSLIEEFLGSPEARMSRLASAVGARREAVTYCLGLMIDFAAARGGDPLRWSPRAVEVFLLDWVHGRALLDQTDVATLPEVLGSWVFWAGRRIGLPDVALQETFDEVGKQRAEFTRLCVTGERQTPAVRATARLIAEGVDLADQEAVDAWLRGYQSEE